MKTKLLTNLTLTSLALVSLLAPAYTEQDKGIFGLGASEAKYTPGDVRPASEIMHTRFGTLEFPDGHLRELRGRTNISY